MKLAKGFNDLVTICPHLAKEWDCKRNNGKSPDQFSAKSGIIVKWPCRCASIRSRTRAECRSLGSDKDTVCVAGKSSFCDKNETVIRGYNDRATLESQLAEE